MAKSAPNPYLVNAPIKLAVEVVSSDMADRAMLMPGVARDGLKLSFVSENMPEAYAGFRALVLLCYPR
jgi:D-aminopeptidase